MPTDIPESALESAWRPAREGGALGTASIAELREHTAGYVSAVCRVLGSGESSDPQTVFTGRAVDVGSGAGVPGLLLAWEFSASRWVLVDAQERRCWYADQAIRALGVTDRVSTWHGRAEDAERGFDLAVARLLGDPAGTTELLAPLLRVGGIAVVSCRSEVADGWCRALGHLDGIEDARVHEFPAGTFLSFRRIAGLDPSLPRRPKRRRTAPLFHVKHDSP